MWYVLLLTTELKFVNIVLTVLPLLYIHLCYAVAWSTECPENVNVLRGSLTYL